MGISPSLVRSFVKGTKRLQYIYRSPGPHEPTICYIPGFQSQCMESNKCHHVYDLAVSENAGFFGWDHANGGSVLEWWSDGNELLEKYTKGPLVLVGPSMGTWIALLLAGRSPVKERIQSIVGVGGGVDFTERWLQEVPVEHREDPKYIWKRPSSYAECGYYAIPVHTLLDSRACLVMGSPLDIRVPVYLIHGQADSDVPPQNAILLKQYLEEHSIEKVYLKLIEDGDHRLSRPQDMDVISSIILSRSNEKKIKELMVDHKKRAERRRAYYESRRGDPRQLLRVVGSAILLHPDAEQYYHHENTNNLMPWQGDPDIKIDRFDGRSLLEFVPDAKARDAKLQPTEDKELSDDLNFERYHDLVEAERLKVSEHDRLAEVEEEWNQLLDRHKALLAMLTEK
ncbi:alternative splicing regulator-domain-containing protein [Phycomyces blakesleeanus]|uniref:Alternative splicing regulator-domain-containing protein n=1 Tax=Phycomyces blakesleeanus TaxID=4837 RepID=A0ABR3B9F6_PHYBL